MFVLHCRRINNCVGEENQFAFMLLLVYAFLLSLTTLILHLLYFFVLQDCVTCNKVLTDLYFPDSVFQWRLYTCNKNTFICFVKVQLDCRYASKPHVLYFGIRFFGQ